MLILIDDTLLIITPDHPLFDKLKSILYKKKFKSFEKAKNFINKKQFTIYYKHLNKLN